LNKIWKIRVFEQQNEAPKYSIEINLSPLQQELLGIKEIHLESTSDSLVSVLAAWKYLEKLISEFAHKDDLIQLFGYYQYRQSSEFKMNLIDSNLALDTTWLLLSGITHGLSVGQTVPIEVLSQALGISSKNLKVSLAKLKKIGYEIRNSNTNSQIDPDHYLIPYSFPTLNERSLQRLTAL
jgi:DNA (cytosine-5)-methyltransferase 1